ncbi:MAG: peptidase [Ectothiorhodospiraceae bacterium]|nr:peptidase [Ectothiorhodospiraceae bacterium]
MPRLADRIVALVVLGLGAVTAVAAPDPASVTRQYATLAQAMYEDALVTARTLRAAVGALADDPSAATLRAARAAWIAARAPYQQTEGFRFGNPVVDAWEGRVNAWPLDEGLIDYVAPGRAGSADANPYHVANVIAHPTLRLGGRTVDAATISPALLRDTLHELDGVEANVATGYHAIEFLLWGQDLHGTGPGAGERPYTDFDTSACTNGNCARRVAYLIAASDLLVGDLEEMVAAWAPGGEARRVVVDDAYAGVTAILRGLGSLSYGELAGERIKLGLMLHDPEEEHDCFSDNTHNAHYHDQLGIVGLYLGRYVRVDGSLVEGPGLSDLVAARDPTLDAEIRRAMSATLDRMQVMKGLADRREMSYDQMIGEGNEVGNTVVREVVDALVAQARLLERAMAPLGISSLAFEGSDSLDSPSAVFK